MKRKTRTILLLALCVVQLCFAVEPFRSGERVVFLGDSITHYGRWWPYIWCAYVDRFSKNPPLFFNAGFSGGMATGALRCLDRDVFTRNPDTVCVMFGMNDVRRSDYTLENSEEDQAAQEDSLKTYRASMGQLLRRITEKGLRCIVVTPSPYDQTMVNSKAGTLNPGVNDGLAVAAQIAKELAHRYECEVVDFHGQMTRINAERQAKDPSATIIGMDRIHPGPEGSKIMAELLLNAQGVDIAALDRESSFSNVWEHVQLERNLRNIVWLDDRILKPKRIDLSEVGACRAFIENEYPKNTFGNRLRAASYLEWRGREDELYRRLGEIEKKLNRDGL